MNRISTGPSNRKVLSKEHVVNFSVAAGSLWLMRHLLFGMLFYFMICHIPGIMVKADLLGCVCISLLLSTGFYISVFAITALLSLSWVTYRLYKDSEEFLAGDSPKMDWLKDKRFTVPFFILGVITNALILKVFSSFYPNMILVDSWNAAFLAGLVMVIANRSLNALQKNVVKLSLLDDVNNLTRSA